jgi:hypothetical protein
MLYLFLGAFAAALLIAGIAQYQKRGRNRFYAEPHGTDVPFSGPEPHALPGTLKR